jgi:hypothetical protein
MKLAHILSLCLVTVALGCGGGGGGGGGNETGVRVLHAAIDAVPVDLLSTGQGAPLVSGAAFGIASDYSPLPEGTITLGLSRAHSPADVIASHPVTVEAGQRYSVFLYGDNATFGLRSRVLSDAIPEDSSGSALVRIVDGTTGALALRVVNGNGSFHANVEFGGSSDYLPVAPGNVRFQALRAADGRALASAAVELEGGRAYTILFAGEAEYYVKAVVYQDN